MSGKALLATTLACIIAFGVGVYVGDKYIKIATPAAGEQEQAQPMKILTGQTQPQIEEVQQPKQVAPMMTDQPNNTQMDMVNGNQVKNEGMPVTNGEKEAGAANGTDEETTLNGGEEEGEMEGPAIEEEEEVTVEEGENGNEETDDAFRQFGSETIE